MYERKEYSRLIISGNPPQDAILEAWDAIYLEYCEMMNDGTYNEVLEKGKDVQVLNGRVTLIDGIVKHLRVAFDKSLVEALKFMAIPCDLSATDMNIESKLKKVLSWGKRLIIQLEAARNELEKAQAEKRTEEGEDYFDDWLLSLSRSYGYTVRDKDLSVVQFCKAIKKLKKDIEKANHGNR